MGKPLLNSLNESGSLPALSPNDHARMLVELLRPLGAELGRRWLAALLIVSPEDRASLVAEIERRIVAEYGGRETDKQEVRVIGPEVQRDGYSERIETVYEVKPTRLSQGAREPEQGQA